jgi:hypothetical protein
MAPEPPADFVKRPKEFDSLKRQLLDAKGDAVAITAALRGAGGYGKTTLAKALMGGREYLLPPLESFAKARKYRTNRCSNWCGRPAARNRGSVRSGRVAGAEVGRGHKARGHHSGVRHSWPSDPAGWNRI